MSIRMELRWRLTLFPFFPQRRGKAAHCASPPREKRKKEKKKYHLFLNFPRTQITQGEWKHRDEERWFGNSMLELKNQESARSQEMSEFPVPKRMGFIVCVLEKNMLSFASFCYFFSTLIPARTFLQYDNYLHLPFPRNPSSPSRASLFSVPPFLLFKLILIKLA